MARITIEIPDFYDIEMIMHRYVKPNDNCIVKLLNLYEIDAKTGETIFTCPIFNHFVDNEFDVENPFVLFTLDGPIVRRPGDIGQFKREDGHD